MEQVSQTYSFRIVIHNKVLYGKVVEQVSDADHIQKVLTDKCRSIKFHENIAKITSCKLLNIECKAGRWTNGPMDRLPDKLWNDQYYKS